MMNSCIEKKECICQKYNSIPKECINKLEVRDSGKSVKLSLKANEEAIAVILDNCLITTQKRCDALFLLKGSKNFSFLVELKGFGEIEKAFEQLAFTTQRDEYKKIIECFKNLYRRKIYQKYFIVTNGKLDNSEKEKFENHYNVRVAQILTNEATKPIPDLRDFV